MHAGCFNDEMHVGEDVDLTWRLRDNGWTISYQPVGRVYHEHRSTPRSFMSRRFDYGTSEGLLQRLHPRRRKRMVIPPLLALLLLLSAAAPFTNMLSLAAAVIILSADAIWNRRRLASRGVPIGTLELMRGRIRALGSLVYYLSYHLVRYYTIPLLAVSAVFPLTSLLFSAALITSARVDHKIRKPHLPFLPFLWIYFMEQAAYGAGVFWGCLNRKTFASYRVVILGQSEPAT
jgi:cellulose synthase/poly-beta-1,6-N-acetylglucosamine synthase-like glycosyltransferase